METWVYSHEEEDRRESRPVLFSELQKIMILWNLLFGDLIMNVKKERIKNYQRLKIRR